VNKDHPSKSPYIAEVPEYTREINYVQLSSHLISHLILFGAINVV